MMVYIPIDGWTIALMALATIGAIAIEKDWRAVAILWGAFFLAAIAHQLLR